MTAKAIGLCVVALCLAACAKPRDETLSPAEAAHWLQLACGVQLAAPPTVLKGLSLRADGTQGWKISVSGTLSLSVLEATAALETLRNNRRLFRRGESVSRYSYESVPGAPQETACELDTLQRQLYFAYTE